MDVQLTIPIRVVYAVYGADRCSPVVLCEWSPSGFFVRGTNQPNYGEIVIPLDPISAIRMGLVTAQQLGFSDAVQATLSLLLKP